MTNREMIKTEPELLRDLINKSNDAIFVNDPKTGFFIFVNDKACASLGYDRQELLRISVMDIETTLPDNISWRGHIDKLREKGSILMEGIHKRKDGTTFPVEVNVSYAVIDNREHMIAIVRDITDRNKMEVKRDKLIFEVSETLASVKKLSGLLPICASCKKIRDDKGYWNQIEMYIREHSEADFTHSICPGCVQKLYPEFHDKFWENEDKEIGQ